MHTEQTVAGITHLLSDPRYWLHDDEQSALQGARISLLAARAAADKALDALAEAEELASEVVDGVHDSARPFIQR
jgi:hypothetical protein